MKQQQIAPPPAREPFQGSFIGKLDEHPLKKYWFLYIPTLLVSLALLIIAVILFSGRRNTQNPVTPLPEEEHAFLLVALTGHFKGGEFPLIRSSTSLGRDPKQCNIVFPRGTERISKIHVEVSLKENRVMVRDTYSTNGSSLDGTNLIPGEWRSFSVGQVLTIGNNSFVLKEKSNG